MSWDFFLDQVNKQEEWGFPSSAHPPQMNPLDFVLMAKGPVAVVEKMIKQYPTVVHDRMLLNVCKNGTRPGVFPRLLASNPSSLVLQDDMGRTAMHYALIRGPKMVYRVPDRDLEHAVTVSPSVFVTEDNNSRSPLWYLFYYEFGHQLTNNVCTALGSIADLPLRVLDCGLLPDRNLNYKGKRESIDSDLVTIIHPLLAKVTEFRCLKTCWKFDALVLCLIMVLGTENIKKIMIDTKLDGEAEESRELSLNETRRLEEAASNATTTDLELIFQWTIDPLYPTLLVLLTPSMRSLVRITLQVPNRGQTQTRESIESLVQTSGTLLEFVLMVRADGNTLTVGSEYSTLVDTFFSSASMVRFKVIFNGWAPVGKDQYDMVMDWREKIWSYVQNRAYVRWEEAHVLLQNEDRMVTSEYLDALQGDCPVRWKAKSLIWLNGMGKLRFRMFDPRMFDPKVSEDKKFGVIIDLATLEVNMMENAAIHTAKDVATHHTNGIYLYLRHTGMIGEWSASMARPSKRRRTGPSDRFDWSDHQWQQYIRGRCTSTLLSKRRRSWPP